MNKKKLIIGIVCAVVVLGAGWYFLSGKSSKGGIQLITERATRQTIRNSVTATGTVEAVTQVEVGTQVSGIIDKIYVDYNSEVKAGQLIAEMDKVTLQSELKAQQAELATYKTEYEYQEKNYNRNKTLYEKELLSDADYETAKYNYDKAKANYEKSLASLAKAERNLGYATITSPIDGVVISRAVEEGQTVAAGFSTPTLFTIANDLTQMQVIADVDEADIGQVAEGQKVTFTVDAYPNDKFEGEVTQVRLEATVESNVVTYEVVISAPNPDLKLKPGLTANVTIVTFERENVLTIPSKSIRFMPDAEILAPLKITFDQSELAKERSSDSLQSVWVIDGSTLSCKQVKTGTTTGNYIEVLEGIDESDNVVVELSGNAQATATQTAEEQEQSPFMPQRPGSNKKSSSK